MGLLWPDTFTNYFHPRVGRATVAVLEAAGWRGGHPYPAAVDDHGARAGLGAAEIRHSSDPSSSVRTPTSIGSTT
jgi:hypothetical protein